MKIIFKTIIQIVIITIIDGPFEVALGSQLEVK